MTEQLDVSLADKGGKAARPDLLCRKENSAGRHLVDLQKGNPELSQTLSTQPAD